MKNIEIKNSVLIILFLWMFTLTTGCRQNEPNIILSATSSMIKVPMELEKPIYVGDTAKINAAGGEYESFQVIISSKDSSALEGIHWKVDALTGKNGEIGVGNITVNPVGYVQTTTTSKSYPSSLGWWPDPLLQIDTLSIPAGERQPLWVTIYVPRGTPAGLYNGYIHIKADKKGSSGIPVSLRVWGFNLPLRPSLKTLTWVSSLKDFGGNSRKNRKAFYELLLKHRLGPGGRVELDEEMLDFCIDRGMNAFILDNIPNLKRNHQDNFTDEYKSSLQKRLNKYVKKFAHHGWLNGMAYVYNYDEVDKKHWPLAKEMYSLVKNVSSDLNVIQCLNIPEGVKALAGYADTWDVYVSQYEKSGVKNRVKKGDEAWLAVCCYPSVRPNLFLEYPAIDGRILGWICFQTGVTGFEYWSPNHWKGNISSPGLRGDWKANTFLNYNGDGYLTYPAQGGGILSSVRLENLRDGFEDYEYLNLLKKLGGNTELSKTVVSGPTDYTSDFELLYQIRKKIATEIEKILEANNNILSEK